MNHHEAVTYQLDFGDCLLQKLHGVSVILSTLSIYFCSDFLPVFALLSCRSKELYSSTNKNNTCTEGHPTSFNVKAYHITKLGGIASKLMNCNYYHISGPKFVQI